jgi:hypothetical protein
VEYVLTVLNLALVGATLWLVFTTRETAKHAARSADAAEKQARAAQETVTAMVQPLISSVPRPMQRTQQELRLIGHNGMVRHTARGQDSIVVIRDKSVEQGQDEWILASVPVQNVGSGTAVISKAEFRFGECRTSNVRIMSSVLPRGQECRIEGSAPSHNIDIFSEPGKRSLRTEFELTTWYVSSSGTGAMRSVIEIGPGGNTGHVARRIRFYQADEVEPFATTEYLHWNEDEQEL